MDTNWLRLFGKGKRVAPFRRRRTRIYFARCDEKNRRFVSLGEAALVPIARGQHLFPCRTQQLSLGAVTILGVHPWENSTVPNYTKSLLRGGFLFCITAYSVRIAADASVD